MNGMLIVFAKTTLAGFRPNFGGEYTNLCGSGTSATFYSCPANCNIQEGWCETREGQFIYASVCSGRKFWCLPLNQGPFTGRKFLTDFAQPGSNLTVQINVIGRLCSGEFRWLCGLIGLLPQVKGFMVWYSGPLTPTINQPQVLTLTPL